MRRSKIIRAGMELITSGDFHWGSYPGPSLLDLVTIDQVTPTHFTLIEFPWLLIPIKCAWSFKRPFEVQNAVDQLLAELHIPVAV